MSQPLAQRLLGLHLLVCGTQIIAILIRVTVEIPSPPTSPILPSHSLFLFLQWGRSQLRHRPCSSQAARRAGHDQSIRAHPRIDSRPQNSLVVLSGSLQSDVLVTLF